MAVALVALATSGAAAAGAALIGTALCVVPNGFLAARLLLSRASQLMRAIWIGEIGKLALTVVLFGAVFSILRPAPLWVLLAFIVAQFGTLAGLLLPTETNGDDTHDG